MKPTESIRGIGRVRIAQTKVLAYFIHEENWAGRGRCRIRVRLEEYVALGLQANSEVSVRLLGREEWVLKLRGVLKQSPFAWLEFEGVGERNDRPCRNADKMRPETAHHYPPHPHLLPIAF